MTGKYTEQNEVKELLHSNALYEASVLRHGWLSNSRDYCFHLLTHERHTIKLSFCGCVEMQYQLCLKSQSIKFEDEFLHIKSWEETGCPEGFVWGGVIDLYPGLSFINDSELAKKWSDSLGEHMYEAQLETNAFKSRVVFNHISVTQITETEANNPR